MEHEEHVVQPTHLWCKNAPRQLAQHALREYCQDIEPAWAWPAEEYLCICSECLDHYQEGKKILLEQEPNMNENLRPRESLRLRAWIDAYIEQRENDVPERDVALFQDTSQRNAGGQLQQPIREILQHPKLLFDKNLNASFVKYVEFEYSRPAQPSYAAPIPVTQMPGILMLLIHPNQMVRKWASKMLPSDPPITRENYDEVADIITRMLSPVEFALFETLDFMMWDAMESNILPRDLVCIHDQQAYWKGIMQVLKCLDKDATKTRLMGPGGHCAIAKALVNIIMETKEFGTSIDSWETSVFWPALECLEVLLSKLEYSLWQYISESPDQILMDIVSHPVFEIAISGQQQQSTFASSSSARSSSVNDVTTPGGLSSSKVNANEPFIWLRTFVRSFLNVGDRTHKYIKSVILFLVHRAACVLDPENSYFDNDGSTSGDALEKMQQAASVLDKVMTTFLDIMESLLQMELYEVLIGSAHGWTHTFVLYLQQHLSPGVDISKSQNQTWHRCLKIMKELFQRGLQLDNSNQDYTEFLQRMEPHSISGNQCHSRKRRLSGEEYPLEGMNQAAIEHFKSTILGVVEDLKKKAEDGGRVETAEMPHNSRTRKRNRPTLHNRHEEAKRGKASCSSNSGINPEINRPLISNSPQRTSINERPPVASGTNGEENFPKRVSDKTKIRGKGTHSSKHIHADDVQPIHQETSESESEKHQQATAVLESKHPHKRKLNKHRKKKEDISAHKQAHKKSKHHRDSENKRGVRTEPGKRNASRSKHSRKKHRKKKSGEMELSSDSRREPEINRPSISNSPQGTSSNESQPPLYGESDGEVSVPERVSSKTKIVPEDAHLPKNIHGDDVQPICVEDYVIKHRLMDEDDHHDVEDDIPITAQEPSASVQQNGEEDFQGDGRSTNIGYKDTHTTADEAIPVTVKDDKIEVPMETAETDSDDYEADDVEVAMPPASSPDDVLDKAPNEDQRFADNAAIPSSAFDADSPSNIMDSINTSVAAPDVCDRVSPDLSMNTPPFEMNATNNEVEGAIPPSDHVVDSPDDVMCMQEFEPHSDLADAEFQDDVMSSLEFEPHSELEEDPNLGDHGFMREPERNIKEGGVTDESQPLSSTHSNTNTSALQTDVSESKTIEHGNNNVFSEKQSDVSGSQTDMSRNVIDDSQPLSSVQSNGHENEMIGSEKQSFCGSQTDMSRNVIDDSQPLSSTQSKTSVHQTNVSGSDTILHGNKLIGSEKESTVSGSQTDVDENQRNESQPLTLTSSNVSIHQTIGDEIICVDNATQDSSVSTEHKYSTPSEVTAAFNLITESSSQDEAEERLAENCREAGLTFHGDTPGDGNCFFHAVSDQLTLLGLPHQSHEQLRQSVVTFLTHHQTIEGQDGIIELSATQPDWDAYLDSMSKDGEWADAIVLVAMARMLNRDILVVTSSPQGSGDQSVQWTVGDPNFQGQPVMLGHLWECHYRSLVHFSTDVYCDSATTPKVSAWDEEVLSRKKGYEPWVLLPHVGFLFSDVVDPGVGDSIDLRDWPTLNQCLNQEATDQNEFEYLPEEDQQQNEPEMEDLQALHGNPDSAENEEPQLKTEEDTDVKPFSSRDNLFHPFGGVILDGTHSSPPLYIIDSDDDDDVIPQNSCDLITEDVFSQLDPDTIVISSDDDDEFNVENNEAARQLDFPFIKAEPETEEAQKTYGRCDNTDQIVKTEESTNQVVKSEQMSEVETSSMRSAGDHKRSMKGNMFSLREVVKSEKQADQKVKVEASDEEQPQQAVTGPSITQQEPVDPVSDVKMVIKLDRSQSLYNDIISDDDENNTLVEQESIKAKEEQLLQAISGLSTTEQEPADTVSDVRMDVKIDSDPRQPLYSDISDDDEDDALLEQGGQLMAISPKSRPQEQVHVDGNKMKDQTVSETFSADQNSVVSDKDDEVDVSDDQDAEGNNLEQDGILQQGEADDDNTIIDYDEALGMSSVMEQHNEGELNFSLIGEADDDNAIINYNEEDNSEKERTWSTTSFCHERSQGEMTRSDQPAVEQYLHRGEYLPSNKSTEQRDSAQITSREGDLIDSRRSKDKGSNLPSNKSRKQQDHAQATSRQGALIDTRKSKDKGSNLPSNKSRKQQDHAQATSRQGALIDTRKSKDKGSNLPSNKSRKQQDCVQVTSRQGDLIDTRKSKDKGSNLPSNKSRKEQDSAQVTSREGALIDTRKSKDKGSNLPSNKSTAQQDRAQVISRQGDLIDNRKSKDKGSNLPSNKSTKQQDSTQVTSRNKSIKQQDRAQVTSRQGDLIDTKKSKDKGSNLPSNKSTTQQDRAQVTSRQGDLIDNRKNKDRESNLLSNKSIKQQDRAQVTSRQGDLIDIRKSKDKGSNLPSNKDISRQGTVVDTMISSSNKPAEKWGNAQVNVCDGRLSLEEVNRRVASEGDGHPLERSDGFKSARNAQTASTSTATISTEAPRGRRENKPPVLDHNRPQPVVVRHASIEAAKVTPSKKFHTDNFLKWVLSWNCDWLTQREAIPKVSEILSNCHFNTLKEVPEEFDNMDQYYEVFIPHLLVETWAKLCKEYHEAANPEMECSMYGSPVKDAKYSGLIKACQVRVPIPQDKSDSKFNLYEEDFVIISPRHLPDTNPACLSVFGIVSQVSREKILRQSSIESSRHEVPKKYREVTLLTDMNFQGYDGQEFNLQLVGSLEPATRQFSALISFHKSTLARDILRFRRMDVFCHDNSRRQRLESGIPCTSKEVTNAAVKALSEPDTLPRIFLLQGPPGTGKTYTIINTIVKMLQMRDAQPDGNHPKILLCAPSDTAVDTVVRSLVKALMEEKERSQQRTATPEGRKPHQNTGQYSLIRLGRRRDVHASAKPFSLEYAVESEIRRLHKNRTMFNAVDRRVKDLYKRIRNEKSNMDKLKSAGKKDEHHQLQQRLDKLCNLLRALEDKKPKTCDENRIRQEVLTRADVICCSLNFSGSQMFKSHIYEKNNRLKQLINFSCVIVDEATQCTEPDCLIPLQYGSSKLLLVGDPQQLPATVISQEAARKKYSQSLFERHYRYFKLHREIHDNPVRMLREQFRMHSEICRFPSQWFCEGSMVTNRDVARQRDRIFFLNPYLVFDVADGREHSYQHGDFDNEEEANFLMELCNYIQRELRRRHQQPITLTIGIITPYRKQKHLLIDKFRGRKDVEIGTEDCFQGREKDVILLSCVRSSQESQGIGLVLDPNRMNLALTRARYALYVIGNLESLYADSKWRALIKDAHQRKLTVKARRGDYRTVVTCCKKRKRSIGGNQTKKMPSKQLGETTTPATQLICRESVQVQRRLSNVENLQRYKTDKPRRLSTEGDSERSRQNEKNGNGRTDRVSSPEKAARHQRITSATKKDLKSTTHVMTGRPKLLISPNARRKLTEGIKSASSTTGHQKVTSAAKKDPKTTTPVIITSMPENSSGQAPDTGKRKLLTSPDVPRKLTKGIQSAFSTAEHQRIASTANKDPKSTSPVATFTPEKSSGQTTDTVRRKLLVNPNARRKLTKGIQRVSTSESESNRELGNVSDDKNQRIQSATTLRECRLPESEHRPRSTDRRQEGSTLSIEEHSRYDCSVVSGSGKAKKTARKSFKYPSSQSSLTNLASNQRNRVGIPLHVTPERSSFGDAVNSGASFTVQKNVLEPGWSSPSRNKAKRGRPWKPGGGLTRQDSLTRNQEKGKKKHSPAKAALKLSNRDPNYQNYEKTYSHLKQSDNRDPTPVKAAPRHNDDDDDDYGDDDDEPLSQNSHLKQVIQKVKRRNSIQPLVKMVEPEPKRRRRKSGDGRPKQDGNDKIVSEQAQAEQVEGLDDQHDLILANTGGDAGPERRRKSCGDTEITRTESGKNHKVPEAEKPTSSVPRQNPPLQSGNIMYQSFPNYKKRIAHKPKIPVSQPGSDGEPLQMRSRQQEHPSGQPGTSSDGNNEQATMRLPSGAGEPVNIQRANEYSVISDRTGRQEALNNQPRQQRSQQQDHSTEGGPMTPEKSCLRKPEQQSRRVSISFSRDTRDNTDESRKKSNEYQKTPSQRPTQQ